MSYLYIEQLSVEYRDEHNFVKNLNVNMFYIATKIKFLQQFGILRILGVQSMSLINYNLHNAFGYIIFIA